MPDELYTYVGGPMDGLTFTPTFDHRIVDDGTFSIVVLGNDRLAWYLRQGDKLVFDMICTADDVVKLPPPEGS